MSHDPSISNDRNPQYSCHVCKKTTELRFGAKEPDHGLCHPCASVALDEALETFFPFALHGRALRSQDRKNLQQLKVISKAGVSSLVGGCFSSAIEFFTKYVPRFREQERQK